MYKYEKITRYLILIVLLITGCSVSKDTNNSQEVKETVVEEIENQSNSYRGTQRTLTTTLDAIEKYSIQDDKILGVGDKVDKESEVISYYLTSWEENWRDEWAEQKQIELPFTSSKYMIQCNGLDMDAEGNTYAIFTDNSQNHIYFIKVDSSGEIILNCDIASNLPEDIYISGMAVASDGKIYITDNQENILHGFDAQGNYIGTYKPEVGQTMYLIKNNENAVHLVTEKMGQLYLNQPLTEEIAFQADGELIPVNKCMGVYEGINNNFFVTTPTGLFAYTLGDSTIRQLVEWSLSGIYYIMIDYVGVMEGEEEQEITVIVETEVGNKSIDIYTFRKTNESENQKLILATLGSVGSELNKQIVNYNKLHPDFPIQTKTYLGNEDGLRQLNTDLLAGNIIDIVNVKSFEHLTSIDYYVDQGLLEDIGQWIKDDETIDETDLLQSVLDANKVDGVLYNLVPSFVIETLSGAKSIVGDDFVWTVEEALNVMATHPESTMYTYKDKEQFLSDMCRYNGDFLVNKKEGTCHFTSEPFIQLLTYASTLSDYSDKEWEAVSYRELIYDQKNLLVLGTRFEAWLKSYRSAKILLKEGVAQDDFSIVGFPTMDENVTNGSIIVNKISISMASTSQKKEQAWGFFQYLLSDAYQTDETLKKIGFPIKESVIQGIFESQLTDEYEAESTGFGFVRSTGEEILFAYGYPTQDDIKIMTDFIHSLNRLAWENDKIYNIILEEAQYYFAGECTAEEAAQKIQSRVELYLMEKE